MKKLPVGIQAFSKLREENCVYVDKTKYIYEMIETGNVCFLSRPRRFGKSLLVSTMENLFNGEKEMFRDLFIYDKWDWDEKNPVIKLDFGSRSCSCAELLKKSLLLFLKQQAEKFEIVLDTSEPVLSDIFEDLITKLHNKFNAKVVILIDEYDRPLLDNISEPKIMNANRKILHNFYQVLKAKDEFIRFIFITGVSKFSGVSIFSGLNNIEDITFDPKYNPLCGYTQEELESNFSEHISATAQKMKMSKPELLAEIKYLYDGYSWNGVNRLYNPFSTLRFFKLGKFKHFWFATGTPTFLVNVLKERNNIESLFENISVDLNDFDSCDVEDVSEIALLLQTGYLTLKEKEGDENYLRFKVGIPNTEVKKALTRDLFRAYAKNPNILSPIGDQMKEQILAHDAAGFEKNLKTLLAKVPYTLMIKQEAHLHSLFLLAMAFVGFEFQGEEITNRGRIDAAMKGKDWTVVAELKYSAKKSTDTLIKEAFNQIEGKKYYEKYLSRGKIILLAIAYAKKDLKCEIKALS